MNKRNISYTRLSPIPEWLYQKAERRAEQQAVFSNSHRKEEANEVGCLGEVIFEHWLNQRGLAFTQELEKTTHDYRINGLTLDVKTKDRTVAPLRYFDNSAPLYNHEHQKPDFFYFISLQRQKGDDVKNLRKYFSAALVGGIGFQELDTVGIPFLAGEEDWRNGTTFWTDCLNVEMWQLIPNNEMLEILSKKRCQPSQKADVNTPIVNEIKHRISQGLMASRNLPSHVAK